jgi:hypothetical protein
MRKIGLMWGKSIGMWYTHYFLYLTVGAKRIQLIRIKLKRRGHHV